MANLRIYVNHQFLHSNTVEPQTCGSKKFQLFFKFNFIKYKHNVCTTLNLTIVSLLISQNKSIGFFLLIKKKKKMHGILVGPMRFVRYRCWISHLEIGKGLFQVWIGLPRIGYYPFVMDERRQIQSSPFQIKHMGLKTNF